MARHPLTDFLLLLATDRKVIKAFESLGRSERELFMEGFGLNKDSIYAVSHPDDPTKGIKAELDKEWSKMAGGPHYTIQLTLELNPKKPHHEKE